MSSDNLTVSDDSQRNRITQGDGLIAKDHLATTYLFVGALFDPLGVLGGVATLGPVPHQMPQPVFYIREGFFGSHVT